VTVRADSLSEVLQA